MYKITKLLKQELLEYFLICKVFVKPSEKRNIKAAVFGEIAIIIVKNCLEYSCVFSELGGAQIYGRNQCQSRIFTSLPGVGGAQ